MSGSNAVPITSKRRRGSRPHAIYHRTLLLGLATYLSAALVQIRRSAHIVMPQIEHINEIEEQPLRQHVKDIQKQPLHKKDESASKIGIASSVTADLDAILRKHPNVVTVMPAKGGGSTLKDFLRFCLSSSTGITGYSDTDNFLNFPPNATAKDRNGFDLEPLLNVPTGDGGKPKIAASHLYNDRPMLGLVRYAQSHPNGTAIFYSFRPESSRLVSAIRHVAVVRMCAAIGTRERTISVHDELIGSYFFHKNVERNETDCILNEEGLQYVIREEANEILYSTPHTLSSQVWQALEEMRPSNIWFLDYQQLDLLQSRIAHHYCPNVPPLHSNTQAVAAHHHPGSVGMQYSVRVADGTLTRLVPLDEWLKVSVLSSSTGTASNNDSNRPLKPTPPSAPLKSLQEMLEKYPLQAYHTSMMEN